MVIPNFFITFVRHIFHTSHTLHAPPLARDGIALHLPATRHHTPLMAHALPHALSARDCLTRCTSQGLCHTRHTHAMHPRPHSTHALRATTLAKGYATRATHTLRILVLTAHSPSALPPLTRAMPHAPHTRYASSPSQHTRPPCYHPSQRAMPHAPHTRYASSPSQHTRPPRYHPSQGTTPCRATTKHESHAPPRTHAPASFLRRKREPHNNQNITYYNITCNVYPNRSKDYTKKRGNLFLYRLNLLSLHDES